MTTILTVLGIALIAVGTFAANWKLGCVVTGIALWQTAKLALKAQNWNL